jgi:hypothetical protein
LKKFFAPITHAINILHQLHCIHIPATRGATINRYTLVPSSQAKVGTHEKPRRFFNTLDLLLNPPTNHPEVARAPETIHATASFCSHPSKMVLPSYYDSKPLPKPSVHRRTRSSFAASSPDTSRNSSLNKVWSEDYYSYDCEWGNQGEQDKEEGLQIKLPEPATLTSRPFPRSIPLTETEDHYPPRQPRTHQRSLTALLPFRTKSSSRSPERKSPKKEKTQIEFEDEFMPTLTGDRDGVIRIEEKPRGGLSSWFSGSSAPVAIGVALHLRICHPGTLLPNALPRNFENVLLLLPWNLRPPRRRHPLRQEEDSTSSRVRKVPRNNKPYNYRRT